MLVDIDQFYRQLRAVHANDYHLCFYCGCIACQKDYAPPRDHLHSYLSRSLSADFLIVPACKECSVFLKGSQLPLVEQRRQLVQNKLKQKYKQAIHVYLSWSEDEVSEMEGNLLLSISAGVKLGEESFIRSSYIGYDFELDGQRNSKSHFVSPVVSVFGQQFNDLKTAITACSQRYDIYAAQLSEDLAKHDNNLEAVILDIQDQQQQKAYRRELNSQCLRFAKQHKLSRMQVVNAVERYIDKNADLTIPQALQQYYEQRVQYY
ncbi:hypothetical protein DBZ36_06050 [Alginatibacterium sediminis]|uniref:Uncharacterized protein n=1 Tax=Alginatibacterium sediminis TaxID=2164068 RepID=A0A420EH22_9ALTE|nr:hypothetical protein [Alginatibacterium sediminis]RKF20012.1 hypothetical protein DBZ36_06050 [Alginatibacterium sediminis]